ncbi:MAG: hypothetical protein OXG25_13935 [Gammaproteobacteria bacterium]|nr:hypothetical protein [Gammaproteobacteria bacterium]
MTRGHDHGIGGKQVGVAIVFHPEPHDDAATRLRPIGRLVTHLPHLPVLPFWHGHPDPVRIK